VTDEDRQEDEMQAQELPRATDGQLQTYAWPGGYPIYYLDAENSVLCAECARKSDSDPDELPNFRPCAADVNYENSSLYCDQCGQRVESAYSEED
jgi:hypothetical protein